MYRRLAKLGSDGLGCIQSVDWTGGLDYWTNRFLLEIHIGRLFNETCRGTAVESWLHMKVLGSLLHFIVPAYRPRPLLTVCVTAHASSTVSNRGCALESSSIVTSLGR